MIRNATPAQRRVAIALLLMAGASAAQAGENPFLGEITCAAFNFAPRGAMPADGRLLPINQNTALFSLLGTTYGGDGRSNFALPDLRGRTIIHRGQGPGLQDFVQGTSAGTESVSLISTEMPQHTHQVTPTGSLADATQISPAGAVPAAKSRTTYFAAPNPAVAMATTPTGVAGAGQPMQIMQPSLTVNCFINTQGVFPSRP